MPQIWWGTNKSMNRSIAGSIAVFVTDV